MTRSLLTLGCAMSLWVGTALAQSAKQPATHPMVRGVVVDSENNPLTAAEVYATDTVTHAVVTTRSDSAGGYRLNGLSAGVPYIFAARRVGFAHGASHAITLRPTDTLNIDFALDPINITLPTVRIVTGVNAAYRIDAAEIAKHPVLDALDVVLQLRPRMLGDPYRECRTDTSHFTFGVPRFMPPIAPSSNRVDPPPRLYVNGVWHGEMGMKNILSEIPADDIAEMRYIDCQDTATPELRNSLMVILKPGRQY